MSKYSLDCEARQYRLIMITHLLGAVSQIWLLTPQVLINAPGPAAQRAWAPRDEAVYAPLCLHRGKQRGLSGA